MPGDTHDPGDPTSDHRPFPAAVKEWRRYQSKFISPEGRVIDDANGGISHSEGQGYGMLIAVRAGDRAGFDRLWTWTRANLELRGDHLAAWRWDPAHDPHVADRNSATDGDLLIAWALSEAGAKWDPAYAAAARSIGPLLLPGAQGFGPSERPDGPVVNLSYWIFPALDRLASISHAADWRAVTRSGLNLIDEARCDSTCRPLHGEPMQPRQLQRRRSLQALALAVTPSKWLGRAKKAWCRTCLVVAVKSLSCGSPVASGV
jgi:hypothetical protein